MARKALPSLPTRSALKRSSLPALLRAIGLLFSAGRDVAATSFTINMPTVTTNGEFLVLN